MNFLIICHSVIDFDSVALSAPLPDSNLLFVHKTNASIADFCNRLLLLLLAFIWFDFFFHDVIENEKVDLLVLVVNLLLRCDVGCFDFRWPVATDDRAYFHSS